MKQFRPKLVGLLTLLLIIHMSPVAWAMPKITNVTGTINDGQQITINGMGFGTVGPVIQLFDSFEKGALNNKIATTINSADIGNWTASDTGRYSDDFALSGSQSLKVDFSLGGLVYNHSLLRFQGVRNTDIFVSWWQYLPVNKVVPGSSGAEGPNWKWFWLGDEDDNWPWGSDFTITCMSDNNCDNIWGPSIQNDTELPKLSGNGYFSTTFQKGTWFRVTVALRNSSDKTGYIWYQEVSKNGNTIQADLTGVTTAHSTDPWNIFALPGYGRNDINAVLYFDDVYIATGDGARARIEIGETSTYSACKKLAIMTPDTWQHNQIKATVRQGQFKNNDKIYLFVIDSDGKVSSGYGPLIIGQSDNL
ncbi:MAG: hypothetical protein GXY53_00475 [Desulfobulbus sp.]|nr:hypothetical protein [Desulfobulbus sp.]